MTCLTQLLCRLTHFGHQTVTVFDGPHRCEVCLCGYRTPGIRFGEPVEATPGTQPYWDKLHEELMEIELAVIGGG